MLLTEYPWVLLSFVLLTSFFITSAVIPAVIRVAREKHLLDEPNNRSSHWQKTPSLGGVAIFAAIIIVFTMASHWSSSSDFSFFQVLPAIVILFFVGIKDDILVIDPVKKLLAQLVAGIIFIGLTDIRIGNFYGMLGVHQLPYMMSFGLTLFIFVVVTNAYNLIDGIDGLAGCLGIIAAIAYGTYFAVVGVIWGTVLCATLVGALVGFLRYNFSKQHKIFMGDSGSLVIGFILAVLSVKFIQFNESPNAWYIGNAPTVAIAVLAIPLFDTLRVFSHRLLRKVSPFTPDRNHVHHLIVDNGHKHAQATIYLSFVGALIIAASLLFAQSSIALSLSVIVLIFTVYALAVQRRYLVRRSKLVVPKRTVVVKEKAVERSRETATLQPQTARATSISA
ncbi:glycosyltransferase family 4 protein [Tunicatimonas pelagia]|uniref:glycosyltransferase family 4 protein n=1 Tax=Tunicatimonas pelagia TaxID=931531 RepID=UPI0026671A65|nr:MraY family glycosyltransferase [Tunicatimonas pelagia]WKN45098.1 MraY family glycosyltransferase [Tunicatimonas pelagia]